MWLFKEILVLLKKVQIAMKNTIVLVSHDLGVHFQLSDYLIILYKGEIVEISELQNSFLNHNILTLKYL